MGDSLDSLRDTVSYINEQISDGFRSFKSSLNGTMGDVPIPAITLSVFTIGLLGTMIYQSDSRTDEDTAEEKPEEQPEESSEQMPPQVPVEPVVEPAPTSSMDVNPPSSNVESSAPTFSDVISSEPQTPTAPPLMSDAICKSSGD